MVDAGAVRTLSIALYAYLRLTVVGNGCERGWWCGIITWTELLIGRSPLASTSRPDEKLAALREQGALNPRPQAVTDQTFATHDFFDSRDLVQVKYEMLRRVQAEGQAVAHAAAAFGFSRQSFYQARAAFAQGGLSGLLPRRRGPHGPHKLRDEVLDFLEQVKAENPNLRSVELVKRVQERFGLTVHPRSIERGLARRGKKTSSPSP